MKDAFTISKLRNIALAGLLAAGVVAPTYAVTQANAETAQAEAESSGETETAQASEATDAQSILDKLLGSNDGEEAAENAPSKTETVYVFANADGSVKNTIVSDWLKNVNGEASLVDESNLENIENTEGEESFSQDGDALTWDAQGADIYYKGDSNDSAPVQLNITYTLDGQTISPDDLAGKSGHVAIRFAYTNTSTVQKTVNGEERTFYTPFACVTGLLLDNDNFTNVTVDNGKLENDGDHTIVAGFAFPGLQQDLDLSSDDVEIPDYFEIEADVTDFNLGSTLTYVSSGLLNDIDTEDLDEDTIGSDIEQVEDAMSQLMSGSDELAEGLDTLADGSHTLADGAGQLSDGSQTLAAGTQTLTEGANQLSGSTGSLVSGVNQLADASAQVDNGLDQLTNGTDTATGLVDAVDSIGAGSTSTQTLYGGTLALQNGLSQLKGNQTDTSGSLYAAKNGADQITAGAKTLSSGTDTLIKSIGTTSDSSTDTINGALNIAQNALKVGNVQTALQSLQAAKTTLETLQKDASDSATHLHSISTTLSGVNSSMTQLRTATDGAASAAGSAATAIGTAQSNISAAETSLNDMSKDGLTADQANAVSNAVSSLGNADSALSTALHSAQSAQTAAQGASGGIETAASSVGDLTTAITSDATAFQTAADDLEKQSEALAGIDFNAATNVATAKACIAGVQENLNKAVGSPTDTQGTLYAAKNGADAIAKGSQSVSDGMTTAIGAIDTQFVPGTQALASGLSILADGGTAPDGRSSAGLSGAVKALGSSTTDGTLLYGTSQMRYGLSTLASLAPLMKEGIDQIASGSGQVNDGAQTIASNMKTLATGADTLATGADTAADGSHTLADGLDEFNDQVVQKIVDAYHDNLEGLSDNLRATVEAGKDYQTFSGKDDAMEGSVKFIYETDSIGDTDD